MKVSFSNQLNKIEKINCLESVLNWCAKNKNLTKVVVRISSKGSKYFGAVSVDLENSSKLEAYSISTQPARLISDLINSVDVQLILKEIGLESIQNKPSDLE